MMAVRSADGRAPVRGLIEHGAGPNREGSGNASLRRSRRVPQRRDQTTRHFVVTFAFAFVAAEATGGLAVTALSGWRPLLAHQRDRTGPLQIQVNQRGLGAALWTQRPANGIGLRTAAESWQMPPRCQDIT